MANGKTPVNTASGTVLNVRLTGKRDTRLTRFIIPFGSAGDFTPCKRLHHNVHRYITSIDHSSQLASSSSPILIGSAIRSDPFHRLVISHHHPQLFALSPTSQLPPPRTCPITTINSSQPDTDGAGQRLQSEEFGEADMRGVFRRSKVRLSGRFLGINRVS